MSVAALPLEFPFWVHFGTEPWRALTDFIAHHASDKSAPAARGDGHTVIIFPGLGTDGSAILPLIDHCRARGYNARDWGLGFNRGPVGDVDAWLAELATHVEDMLVGHDGTATLIGWSLGGVYAREVAKRLKGRIRQVITIATPFAANVLERRFRKPPPVPTTSIYSRTDGIVAREDCRHDNQSARVQDIEIDGSHFGMPCNPAVLRVVTDRLAQRPGGWRPYPRTAA